MCSSDLGLFIETLAVLPRGTEVKVKVPPHKAQVEALALVRNVREGIGMGLEFSSMKPKCRAKLNQLLERCSEHSVP